MTCISKAHRAVRTLLLASLVPALIGCGAGATTGAIVGAAVGAAIGSEYDDPYGHGWDTYYYKSGDPSVTSDF